MTQAFTFFFFFFNNSTIASASCRSLFKDISSSFFSLYFSVFTKVHSKTIQWKYSQTFERVHECIIKLIEFFLKIIEHLLSSFFFLLIKECRNFTPSMKKRRNLQLILQYTSTSFYWRVYWISHSVAWFIFTSYYYVFL